jgi:O-acetyl-ADP-ribose deacetylase (regulator of RNase III)
MLAGGGGVDGAIHRVGGPEIMAELDRIRPEVGGHCPTGKAVATAAGRLPARFVFHAVGPIYRGRGDEAALLESCYVTCLRMADERELKSIAFPAISTGAYGYPLQDAARIAVAAVTHHLESAHTTLRDATFILFDARSLKAFERALQDLLQSRGTRHEPSPTAH